MEQENKFEFIEESADSKYGALRLPSSVLKELGQWKTAFELTFRHRMTYKTMIKGILYNHKIPDDVVAKYNELFPKK